MEEVVSSQPSAMWYKPTNQKIGIRTVYEVIFQKRVRVFHRGFKHEKTDESTRPAASCFYCFRVFETPMKHEARGFEITSPTKKISLNYHLNKVSHFNYYI